MRSFLMLPILLCVLGGTGYYLARRLHRGIASFAPAIHFWPVLLGVGVLLILLILSFARSLLPFPAAIRHVLGVIGAACMGVALYGLLYTIAADLLLLLPRLLKLPFVAHRFFNGFVALAVVIGTLATCFGGYLRANQVKHVAYTVELQGKQELDDLRVVMISDLHLGAVGSEGRLKKVVAAINAEQPDVVCIAGDFFDTDFGAIQNPDAALATLHELRATYGVYACLGNHDGGATFPQMVDFLERANIRLLADESVVIDQRFVLVGRLDASAIGGYGDQTRKPLSDVLRAEDAALPVIVLDHNPAHIDEYGADVDLVLCGHTHQGQVFPANLLTKRMYTVDYGAYRKDAQSPQVIVSSGVGSWGMPLRVGTHCEIVTICFQTSHS